MGGAVVTTRKGIKKRSREVMPHDAELLRLCVLSLEYARKRAKFAQANHTRARIEAALRSAKGALRHVEGMLSRKVRRIPRRVAKRRRPGVSRGRQ